MARSCSLEFSTFRPAGLGSPPLPHPLTAALPSQTHTVEHPHPRPLGWPPSDRPVPLGSALPAGMLSHPPIPIADMAEHTERLKANDSLKLSQEYEVSWPPPPTVLGPPTPTLTPLPPLPPQSIDPGQQFTWEHSNLEVNKPKNRYANVIAYDHSRVILQHIEGSTRPRLRPAASSPIQHVDPTPLPQGRAGVEWTS